MSVPRLGPRLAFPNPALAPGHGLLAWGGDLRTERLLLAYRSGIFPWYGPGEPIMWFSPDPRIVWTPDDFHASKRLMRSIRQGRWEVRTDTAFAEVIALCAAIPRIGQRGETWITPEMKTAYIRLHKLGYAHSVECFQPGTDVLVGGVYGVELGAAFFGESMFSRTRDSSKVALWALMELARTRPLRWIDAQVPTEHLQSLGARIIPRSAFLSQLPALVNAPSQRTAWTVPESVRRYCGPGSELESGSGIISPHADS